jgi:hypothetical protein
MVLVLLGIVVGSGAYENLRKTRLKLS